MNRRNFMTGGALAVGGVYAQNTAVYRLPIGTIRTA